MQASSFYVRISIKKNVVSLYFLNFKSITQVIELLEGIRRSKLPLLCERIVELTQREWLIQPARQDSRLAPRVEAQQNIDEEPQQDEEYLVQEQAVFGGSEGDGMKLSLIICMFCSHSWRVIQVSHLPLKKHYFHYTSFLQIDSSENVYHHFILPFFLHPPIISFASLQVYIHPPYLSAKVTTFVMYSNSVDSYRSLLVF